MYCWMEIMIQHQEGVEYPLPMLWAFATRVEPSIILKYKVLNKGSALPCNSKDIIQSGHYCLYYRGIKYNLPPPHI